MKDKLTIRLLAAGLLAAALACGCTAQTMVVLFRPTPTEPAQYKLTKSPMLILVDDPPTGRYDATIRNNLVSGLHKQFKKNDVNKQVVLERDVRNYQREHPMALQWAPAQLGRELHAEQVVHVVLEPYVPSRDTMDPTARNQVSAFVTVFDAHKGDRLWPLEQSGREIIFKLDTPVLETGSDPAPDLKEKLAAGLSDKIAKLFYDHEISESEDFRRTGGQGPDLP